MKECIKDFCDKETKEKCDSFYKEVFLNRNELVRMLKEENKQLKSQLNQSEEVIDEAIEFINRVQYDPELRSHVYGITFAGTMRLLEILQKYKGDKK